MGKAVSNSPLTLWLSDGEGGGVEGAGGEGKERGKGGRNFTDTGTFGEGLTPC